MQFFATAPRGTEPALRDELRELRFRGVRADRGGVHFEGPLAEGYRACLWSRVAMRVLLSLREIEAPHRNALYDGVSSIDWQQFVTPQTTIAVRANGTSESLTNTQFIAQCTKDAIVDQIRARARSRPNVERDDPDVLVSVFLKRARATLYLDLSGAPLHVRGYRRDIGAAPLKETLAAAMLRLAGWDRRSPLIDPLCGSGTIALEALAWASRIAPGLGRPRFGFERWASFDDAEREQWQALRERAAAERRSTDVLVRASDVDARALETARANAKRAGLTLCLEQRDVAELDDVTDGTFMVSNPPYGERMASEHSLYKGLRHVVRSLPWNTVALLAGTPELERTIGRAAKSYTLYNGAIECRFLIYRQESSS
jgi:putative N6-adenine-specific DNA methylase